MKTILPSGFVLALIAIVLVGCTPGSPPASPTGSHAASPSTAPSGSANSGSIHAGLPADVCTKMPLARVNQLTGWDLTVAQAVDPQGRNAAECHYSNATNTVDASEDVYALVMTGNDAGTFWQQSHDSTTNGVTDLPGVGKRAYSADGAVGVDYGGLVIIISDYASTGGNLDVDQARFLVDELHNLYS